MAETSPAGRYRPNRRYLLSFQENVVEYGHKVPAIANGAVPAVKSSAARRREKGKGRPV